VSVFTWYSNHSPGAVSPATQFKSAVCVCMHVFSLANGGA